MLLSDLQRVQASLEEVYDDVRLLQQTPGHLVFGGRRASQALCLRVWPDGVGRLAAYLDGPARARHPALARTFGARLCLGGEVVVLEQEPLDGRSAAQGGGPGEITRSFSPVDFGNETTRPRQGQDSPSLTSVPALRRRIDALLALADAIAYAHQLGWYHGAIAPETIELGERPRLYDLGAAWLSGGSPSAEEDVAAFLRLVRALSAPDDELHRWLEDGPGRALTDSHPSMRRVEVALAELDAELTVESRVEWHAPVANEEVEVGGWIDHYKIARKLGEGGMAEVFLARDTVLGRSVALKILRRAALSTTEAGRFLEEARATARFSHPNIVVLYATGRFGRRPYLALEYLPGGSLAERLREGPVGAREAVRLGLAIARALREAHRYGLLHCDLKPANVLVPDDGRPRVVDFGLARAVMTLAAPSLDQSWSGTPIYMAPEQWRGEPLTAAVDVWALGMTLFEMVAGHPAREHPGLPLGAGDGAPPPLRTELRPLAELVAACLARTPAERPPIDDVVRVLERLDAAGTQVGASPLEAPFRGLETFDERHRRFFFGREDEATRFLQVLEVSRAVAVAGPSGIGKSSFVQAGVFPRLEEAKPSMLIRLRPGAHPFRALAHALLGLDAAPSGRKENVADLARRLQDHPTLLNLRLHDLAAERDAQVTLFVDQLEEIITQVPSNETRDAFLGAIAGASDGPEDHVRLVVTIRDDFLGRIAESPAGPSILERILVLRPPGRGMLERCIVAPLAAVGYRLAPEHLARQMILDLEGSPAPLPLLQFACRALWEQRDEARLEISESAYAAIGGVQGALTFHADQLLSELSPAELRTARSLLLRLVGPEGTRAILPRPNLVDGLEGTDSVLRRLIEGRLVIARRDVALSSGESVFELAHECLIRSWARLAGWIEETHEERSLLRELEEAAGPWARRGEPEDETWTGATLEHALARVRALDLALPAHVERFLSKGAARARRQRFRQGALIAGALVFTTLLATGSTLAALAFRDQAERMNRAAANLGRFELILRPFDLEPETGVLTPVLASALPALTVRLLEVDRDDASEPGVPLDPRFIMMEAVTSTVPTEARWVVEARGGPAFVSVDGRGKSGRRCGPSEIPLRRLPGYAERTLGKRIVLAIPTCQASQDGMAYVPAGPFIADGPGSPPTRFSAYIDPERTVELDAFHVDRYEVSNRAFGHFAAMAEETGIRASRYPTGGPMFAPISRPNHPAVQVRYASAVAYCRFHGKRIPTSDEWEKAARGGLWLDAEGRVKNPYPRRGFPWGPLRAPLPANLSGDDDGYLSTAPVNAFSDGASPYGVLNLAGNADEWTSTTHPDDPYLHALRGANWDSPPELEHHHLAYANSRTDDITNLTVGFRCVADDRLIEFPAEVASP